MKLTFVWIVLFLRITVCVSKVNIQVDKGAIISGAETVKLTCTTPDLGDNVFFQKDGNNQGGCIVGFLCASTIYDIQQLYANITKLTISSFSCTRDIGSWKCSYGSTYSTTVNLVCSAVSTALVSAAAYCVIFLFDITFFPVMVLTYSDNTKEYKTERSALYSVTTDEVGHQTDDQPLIPGQSQIKSVELGKCWVVKSVALSFGCSSVAGLIIFVCSKLDVKGFAFSDITVVVFVITYIFETYALILGQLAAAQYHRLSSVDYKCPFKDISTEKTIKNALMILLVAVNIVPLALVSATLYCYDVWEKRKQVGWRRACLAILLAIVLLISVCPVLICGSIAATSYLYNDEKEKCSIGKAVCVIFLFILVIPVVIIAVVTVIRFCYKELIKKQKVEHKVKLTICLLIITCMVIPGIYIAWKWCQKKKKEEKVHGNSFSSLENKPDEKEAKSIDLLRECTLLEKLHSDKHVTEVQWTHNGKPIFTENSCIYKGGNTNHPALTILHPSNADSGKYLCKVTFTNETGKTEIKEYQLELTVCDEKISINLLQDCTLLETLRRNRHITGVHWTHNGKSVLTENSCIYKGGDTCHPALTILYASNDDSGKYVCTVTFANEQNITEKKEYHVELVVCGSSKLDKLVKSGKNIQLLKELKGFKNLKTVQWNHNKKRIDIQNSCLYAGGNTNSPGLTIPYASEDDSGKYVCTLVFHNQSDVSHHGITKQFVTHLKVEPIAERNVTEGKEITLIKSLKRNSKDESINSVVWMHNSKQIDVNDSTYNGGDTTDPSLTIVSACLADSGNYLCTLTFHKKADDQSQRVEKRQFAVSLKVNEKKSSKQRALPPLKTEPIEK